MRKWCKLWGESDKLDPNEWGDIYEKRARAALQAILEPSEGMIEAGLIAPNYIEDQSSKRGCKNIFAAMISAALEEK